ncbi:MAG: competence/damage-inducible protein A, partial [Armatimonadota bacterium]
MKNAEIVSVGTELLLGQIVDTHAPVMARLLAENGLACRRRVTVGDNLERLTEVLRESLARAEVVVTIGGLGPTEDDLTREAIAAALDEPLLHDPEVEAALREFFAGRGLRWVESNQRQAMRPVSASLIENPFGTAPGLHVRKGGRTLLALPGPKGEFEP